MSPCHTSCIQISVNETQLFVLALADFTLFLGAGRFFLPFCGGALPLEAGVPTAEVFFFLAGGPSLRPRFARTLNMVSTDCRAGVRKEEGVRKRVGTKLDQNVVAQRDQSLGVAAAVGHVFQY